MVKSSPNRSAAGLQDVSSFALRIRLPAEHGYPSPYR